MLNFIFLFFVILWLVTVIINSCKNKKYMLAFIFLFCISPPILHDFYMKYEILLLGMVVFTNILVYIAICGLNELIMRKLSEEKIKKTKELGKELMLNSALKEYKEEMDLINSNKMPTDEDIKLYYKMYLKKCELDHKDEWITYNIQPYTFEEWKKMARTQRYYFLIAETCDMFIGMYPNVQMIRNIDYRKIVENEKKEI